MIVIAICTGISIIVLRIAYLAGIKSAREMYVDEQIKRVAAESENLHHVRCRQALDDKIISQQKEIAAMKMVS